MERQFRGRRQQSKLVFDKVYRVSVQAWTVQYNEVRRMLNATKLREPREGKWLITLSDVKHLPRQ